MRVGVLEKPLPFELQKVDNNGVYNLYVPGSLNLKEIKDMFRNPPEDCRAIMIFDNQGKDRWGNMIKHIAPEFPELKYNRVEHNGNVYYIILMGAK